MSFYQWNIRSSTLQSRFHWNVIIQWSPSDIPHTNASPKQTASVELCVPLLENKINSWSVRSNYWYPSIRASLPFSTHSFTFRNLFCSGVGAFSQIKHALVLGSEVTWTSDNVPFVTDCSIGIKEVINQLTGLLGTILPLDRGKQCSHSQRWVLTGETTAQKLKQNMKPQISVHEGNTSSVCIEDHAMYSALEETVIRVCLYTSLQ